MIASSNTTFKTSDLKSVPFKFGPNIDLPRSFSDIVAKGAKKLSQQAISKIDQETPQLAKNLVDPSPYVAKNFVDPTPYVANSKLAENLKKIPSQIPQSLQEIGSLISGLMGDGLRDLYFTFKADSHDESTFRVVDFSVEEGLSTPFTIQLTLASDRQTLTEDDIVDKYGVLTLFRNQQVERYFHGVVFSFSKGDTGRHHTFYKMTLVPSFARLSLRTNSRIFQGKSVMDITEELLGEMNITDYGLAIRNSHEPREFCVQYCESDQDFIERLLAEEGIFYYFEHEKEKHTIIFADDNSVVNEIPMPVLYNNHAGGVADSSYIRSLETVAKVKPTDAVLNDYSFIHPSADFKKAAFGDNTGYQNNYEHYMYPGRYKDHAVGEAFTKTRINYLRSDAKTIKGKSDVAGLTTGFMFMMEDHPTIMMNKKWLLTHIRHKGTQPQSLDNAGGEGMTKYENTFSALPKEQQWKPKPLEKPRIYGPQIGKVVGPAGEEIYTDEFGRVKVQFPWDRDGKSNETSSCWIRVAQVGAGPGFGNIVIPRINHEVIVSFLEGDPDQPIVTGATFHATHKASLNLPADKTKMAFRGKTHDGSHSGEGYNEISFENDNNRQMVHIHAQKDMSTMVLNDRTTTVLNRHTEDIYENQIVRVHGGQSMNVQEKQTTLIGGGHVLDVQGKIQINFTESIRIGNGSSVLHMGEDGVVSLTCKKFNIFAEANGEVTAQKLLDFNKDGAKPNLNPPEDPSKIPDKLQEVFPSEGGGE